MTNDELLYALALQSIEGIGPVNGKKLLNYYGSAKELFKQINDEKKRHKYFSQSMIQQLQNPQLLSEAEREISFIEQYNLKVVGFGDPEYPARLKHCHDAPLLLFQKGNFDLKNTRVISIVGTRLMTSYGREFIKTFIKDLKQYRPIVVSGLAYGVDVHAHTESLKNGISTIGVLAHGLDRIYPKNHRNIAEEMLGRGGLITEFISGTIPERMNFVKRNRIIAGLSEATIVVESANKGGSLITAQLAASYHRDVFAVPGRSGDRFSMGSNTLIKSNKAAMITGARDLEYTLGWKPYANIDDKDQKVKTHTLSLDEKTVLGYLDTTEKRMLDQLIIKSGYPVQNLMALLLQLELKGFVRSYPGKKYTAV